MHEHGNEFQVKVTHEDRTEELGGWMSSREEVTQAVARLRWSPAKGYWLQVRNVRCATCPPLELAIVEFPLNPAAAENPRLPRQADRRSSFSTGRASSAVA